MFKFVYFCNRCHYKKILDFDEKHINLMCPDCGNHQYFYQEYKIKVKE